MDTQQVQRLAKARLQIIKKSKIDSFIKTYENDRVAFAHDIIQWDKLKEKGGLAPYQSRALNIVDKNDRIAVLAPRGAGKCLQINEPVRLASGELVSAGSLIDKEFEVLSFDKKFNVKKSKAFAFDNGIRQVVEITTEKGRKLTRTLNHPLIASRTVETWDSGVSAYRPTPVPGWVNAGELTKDSVVAVYKDCLNDDYAISDNEIKIAAYLLGDGGLSTGTPMFSQQDNKQLAEVREIVKDFSCTLKYVGQYDYRISTNERLQNEKGVRINPLSEKLKAWGMLGKTAWYKTLPDWVWFLSKKQLALFVNRLFSTDGWAYCGIKKSGKKPPKLGREIGICTVSQQMAYEIQSALLRLGIQAKVHKKKNSYTISFNDYQNIKIFCEEVGIYGKEKAISKVASSYDLSNVNVRIPKWRSHMLPKNMAWEKVASVRIIEMEPTVGITVPGDETFLTDFVEHNTTLASVYVVHWALIYDFICDWKLVTTAGVNRQLKDFLWPEIHKIARLLDWNKIPREPFTRYELFQQELRLTQGSAIAVSSDDPDLVEGAHASALAYLFDESKAIHETVYDATEGAFSNAGDDTSLISKFLSISTPGDPEGRFYEIHEQMPGYEDWETEQIEIKECIKAGRISQKWANDRKRQWGVNDPRYIQQVLGKFPKTSTAGVVPLAWYYDAVERWKARDEQYSREGYPEITVVALDVADQGPDSTVMAVMCGEDFIKELIEIPKGFDKLNTMRAVNRLADIMRETPNVTFILDTIGVGGPVRSRLIEIKDEESLSAVVVDFVAGAKAIDDWEEPIMDKEGTTRFRNIRTAAWWNIREMLDPQYEPTLCLPEHDLLRKEIIAPRWKEVEDNVIQVERKDDLRKADRLGRSTDYADAVIMACFAGKNETDGNFFVI